MKHRMVSVSTTTDGIRKDCIVLTGRRVVVYGLGEFIRCRLLPYFGPLFEHFGVIRKRDILALLVKHDLGGESGDNAEGALHPHLRH